MRKLKKNMILGLCTVLGLSASVYTVAQATGQTMDITAQLPLRRVAEILGYDVEWNSAAYSVTLTRGGVTVVFQIGNKTVSKGDDVFYLDIAPAIINDQTYVPLEELTEIFERIIEYNPEKHMITITDEATGGIEVIGDDTIEENTNPRGLFGQDFSSVAPTPLADEWYTEGNIPEEIENALRGSVGHVAIYTDNNDIEFGRTGSYFLGDGVYKQDFSLKNGLITTDKQFVTGTGRMAIMLETPVVSDDDLYVGLSLYDIQASRNGIQPFFERAWHKPYSQKVVIVIDELESEKYYGIWLSSVAPKTFTEEIKGVITVAQF